MNTPCRRTRVIFVAAVVGLLALPAPRAEAAGPGRAAARSVARSAQRAVARYWQRIAALDRRAHRQAAVRTLTRPRTVFRYAPLNRAVTEVRQGFGRTTHFTSAAGTGRPLSSASARRRFGLSFAPLRRLTVLLPKGLRVRFAKVHGGARGVGEITTADRLGAGAVRRVVRTR